MAPIHLGKSPLGASRAILDPRPLRMMETPGYSMLSDRQGGVVGPIDGVISSTVV
jgi:hypothetical protein